MDEDYYKRERAAGERLIWFLFVLHCALIYAAFTAWDIAHAVFVHVMWPYL